MFRQRRALVLRTDFAVGNYRRWRITLLQELAAIVGTPGSQGANMEKGDLTCPKCGAGFRRIALSSLSGKPGEFRCTVCDRVLEVFDGSNAVAYRLTVAPSRISG
jgi:predicted Zn finger-like uncharacterized protein